MSDVLLRRMFMIHEIKKKQRGPGWSSLDSIFSSRYLDPVSEARLDLGSTN